MNHKQEMIKQLIEGLEILQMFYEPPEEIAPHFVAWLNQVPAALEAAGMHSERELWNDATTDIKFSPDGSSFPAQMHSTKAFLLGLLDKLSGGESKDELFSMEIVHDTRNYIQRLALQANGCYERGFYDACAVMLRRLIETLIIECFENHSIESKIKNTDGNYMALSDLIIKFLNEPTWKLSRTTKNNLPKLKEIGDLSAHNRRFVANRTDIERLAQHIRVVIQELVYVGVVAKNVVEKS